MASPLWLILASAVAFAFVHIIFRNPIAVTFTFVGGALFAWRNLATGSALTSAFEHSLYGCLMFTVGLGQYFYLGFRGDESMSTVPLRLPWDAIAAI